MVRKVLCTLVLLIVYLSCTAQSRTFSGKVVDSDGEPVIGAGIVYVGRSGGTIADLDGVFSLTIPSGVQTARISAVGFESQDYDVTRKALDNITIVLQVEQNMLDQVVVTGYAQTSVKRITGSVGIITSDKLEAKPLSSVSALMQGEIAGVQIQATSGQPGTQSKIRIRGTNNLSGNSNPLWVVDGVPLQNESNLTSEELAAGGFDDIFVNGVGGINPNDIESITILKDAAAAAIYGSRAANGVIVVTTKKGQSGKLRVNYSNNFIWSFRPQKNLDLMNSAEKLDWEQTLWDEFAADKFRIAQKDITAVYPVVGIVGQVRSGAGRFAGWSEAQQNEYLASLRSIDTDWYSLLFRNSFSHNHHLSLSGGDEKHTYYVSFGANDEDGMLRRNNYQRYNSTARLTLTPAEWLKIEFGYDFSRQSSVSPDSYVDPFKYAYFANPYEKAFNDDGSYAADETYFNLGYYNGRGVEEVMPVAGFSILRELDLNSTTTRNTAGTLRGQIDVRISEPLHFVGLASYSFSSNATDRIVDKSTYTAFRDRLGNDDHSQTNLYGNISQNRTDRDNYVARGHFAFNRTFGGLHTLSMIAGAEIRGAKSNSIFTKRYNYNPVTATTNLPPVSGVMDEWVKEVERLSGEYFSDSRYASFYASADYYLGKTFVFNASLRTDGSSNFGSDRQFNPTWSAGAAWHMGEEQWMKDLGLFSHATLRAAYGYTGDVNTIAPHYLVMQYMLQEYRYYNGEAYMMGSIPTAPNPGLSWEKTQDMKAGLDLGFLKDRLNFNAEAYYRLSTDVVTSSQVMSTTGFMSVYFNSADMMNFGLEGTLSGKIIQSRDWNLSASVNFAYNYNKVLKYSPASKTITSKDRYVEGYPVGALLSGRLEGIDPATGLYTFKLRSDADIRRASDLNDADNYRYYLGTTIAPFSGGFNLALGYKSMRLSLTGVYSFGNKVREKIESPASYYGTRHEGVPTETVQSEYSDLYSNHLNVRKDRTDRWTEAHPDGTKYPRIYDYYDRQYNFALTNPMDYNIVDAIYLKDLSYLRIKTILLSYDLPKTVLTRMKVASLGVNLSLNNFITITGYDGMDPEVPGATYPTTRSVSAGLTLGF